MSLSLETASGSGSSGGLTLIEEVELAAAAAHIEFTGIADTFKDLLLVGRVRSDRAATTDLLLMQVGGSGGLDTGSNYRWMYEHSGVSAANSRSAGDTSITASPLLVAANADAGEFTIIEARLPDYADVSADRFVATRALAHPGSTSYWAGNAMGRWGNQADAITQVRVFPDTGTNLIAGSKLRLYGFGS